MNHLQLSAFTFISFFSNHIDQRRDNQGERSTEFVAHIGEEVEFEFIQLLGLLDTVFLALEFEFYTLLFEHTFTVDLQRAHLFAHTTISIHHLCLQDIAA